MRRSKLSLKLAKLEDRILRIQEEYQLPEDHEDESGHGYLDALEIARLHVHQKYLEAIIDETIGGRK